MLVFPRKNTRTHKKGEVHELFVSALSLVWFAGATPEKNHNLFCKKNRCVHCLPEIAQCHVLGVPKPGCLKPGCLQFLRRSALWRSFAPFKNLRFWGGGAILLHFCGSPDTCFMQQKGLFYLKTCTPVIVRNDCLFIILFVRNFLGVCSQFELSVRNSV